MPRHTNQEFDLKHIRLYAGDWELLKELFPKTEPTAVVRHLVHRTIRRVQERAQETAQAPEIEVNLEDL